MACLGCYGCFERYSPEKTFLFFKEATDEFCKRKNVFTNLCKFINFVEASYQYQDIERFIGSKNLTLGISS